jgi:hypothetical protein
MGPDSGREAVHRLVDDLKGKLEQLTGALGRLDDQTAPPSSADPGTSFTANSGHEEPPNLSFAWMKDAEVPRPRRPRRPTGTSLSPDPRTGNYIWTRWDDKSGRKITRSTKTTEYTYAIQIAAGYEHEYQRQRAGLAVYDVYGTRSRPRPTTGSRRSRSGTSRAG